jgi:outer membrane protein assembly factor BamB
MTRPLTVGIVILALLLPLLAHAADSPAPISHPFICTDNGQGKVFVVSADGKVQWEYPAAQCQDCWALPNGDYLFSHVRGALEVKPDNTVVWEYKSPDGTEVHNCQPLPNGNVMISECGTKRIIEIDRAGNIVKEIKWETPTTVVHLHCRIARKLANGHYMIAFVGEHVVRELDGDGKIVWEYATPGDPYIALRLPNGNTLIGCGDGHKVIEVDKHKNIVWQLDENELPGIPLRFVADIQVLPNGHIVVCNWGGHGHIGEQPLVFEITRDKQVVWKIDDYQTFRAIAGIQLLDIKGDVTKGKILR